MRVLISWARPVAASLALALGLGAVAPPAEGQQAFRYGAGRSRLVSSAEARLAASASSGAVLAQAAGAQVAGDSSGGFFKSRKGAVVLVLLGSVIVWTAVSRKDAIHSPGRK